MIIMMEQNKIKLEMENKQYAIAQSQLRIQEQQAQIQNRVTILKSRLDLKNAGMSEEDLDKYLPLQYGSNTDA